MAYRCPFLTAGADGVPADAEPCPLGAAPGECRPIPDAQGCAEPDILVVAAEPDKRDDQQRLAFSSGEAGYLASVMSAAGIPWTRCRLTYAVRCYPGHRGADPPHFRACRPHLLNTLASRPWRAVVTLGAEALAAVAPGHHVDESHGQVVRVEGRPWAVLPTYGLGVENFEAQKMEHRRRDLQRFGRWLAEGRDLTAPVKLPDYDVYGLTVADYEPLRARLQELVARPPRVLAWDTETEGLDAFRTGAKIVTTAFSSAAGTGFAYALAHPQAPWTQEQRAELEHLTRAVLEDPRSAKVGHNLPFDARWARVFLKCRVRGPWIDTLAAASLAAAGLRTGVLGLKAQASLWETGLGGYEDGLEDWKARNWRDDWPDGDYGKIPLAVLLPYNAADVDATLRVLSALMRRLQEMGLAAFFIENKMPEVQAFHDAEVNGIRLNDGALATLLVELPERMEDILLALHGRPDVRAWETATGAVTQKAVSFNPNSADHVRAFLFKHKKLPQLQATKGTRDLDEWEQEASTGKDVLAQLSELVPAEAELLDAITEYRNLRKFLGTFLTPMRTEHVADDGLVHATFRFAGTDTGRPSCGDPGPNLLNIPARGKLAKKVKSMFASRFPDGWILNADLSQIEPRVVAALSGDPFLLEVYAREDGDIHRANGCILFGVPYEQVVDDLRTIAKTIGLGILYGAGPPKVAAMLTKAWHDIGKPRIVTAAEAEILIETYWARFAGVLRFKEESIRYAAQHGHVVNAFGRVRELPGMYSPAKWVQRDTLNQAVNTRVQSSASDILLASWGRVATALREGYRSKLVLTIYDSIVVDAHPAEVEAVTQLLIAEMVDRSRLPFMRTVPLKADIEKRRTFGGWDESLAFYPEPGSAVGVVAGV